MILPPFRKILIPRFDTIGDIILVSSFIKALTKCLPQAEITILVRKGYEKELSPLFDSLRLNWLTHSFNPYDPVTKGNEVDITIFLESIASGAWDLVLFTTYNRTFLEDIIASRLHGVWKIGIGPSPNHSSYHFEILRQLHLHLTTYDLLVPVVEHERESNKYIKLLQAIFPGYTNSAPDFDLVVPPEAVEQAQQFLDYERLNKVGFYICMPAGLMTTKIKAWDPAKFASVAKWAADNLHIQPVVVGHESEKDIVQRTADHIRLAGIEPHVWFGRGGDLQVLAALLKRARFYVGNDSAPMHLSAAVGTPTVGIFGGGHWPRFVPAGRRSIGVAAPLPCFYCHWDCIFGDAPCVRLVSVDDVIRAISIVLSDTEVDHGNILISSHAVDSDAKELVEKSRGVIHQLRGELHMYREVIDSLNERLNRASREHSDIVSKINNSLSWRITRPLRLLGKAFLRRRN